MGIANTLRCIECGEAVTFDPEVDVQMVMCDECEKVAFTIPKGEGRNDHKLVGSEGIFRFAQETHRDRQSLLEIIEGLQSAISWATSRLQRTDDFRVCRKVGNVLDKLPYVRNLDDQSTNTYDFIRKELSKVTGYIDLDSDCEPSINELPDEEAS